MSSDYFYPHQFITYMFAHDLGGFSHLFFNMLAFVFLGVMVEDYLGSKRFLSFILICGIGVGAFWMIWQIFPSLQAANDLESYINNPSYSKFVDFLRSYFPNVLRNLDNFNDIETLIEQYETSPEDPAVIAQSQQFLQYLYIQLKNSPFSIRGFSGVVFGIVALCGMLFPNNEIRLLFPPISLKMKYFALIYIAIEFYFLLNKIQSNTSHLSHVLGVGVAIIMLKVWEIIDQRRA